jgi:hypothetical protein
LVVGICTNVVGVPVEIFLLQMATFDLVWVFYLQKFSLEQCLVHLFVFVQVFGVRFLLVDLGARKETALMLDGKVEDLVFGVKLIYRAVHIRVLTLLTTRDKSVALGPSFGLSLSEEKLAADCIFR